MPALTVELMNNILNKKDFGDSINGMDASFVEAIRKNWANLSQDNALNSDKFPPLLALLHDMFSVVCASKRVIEIENIPIDISEIIKKIINMQTAEKCILKFAFFEGERWIPDYKSVSTEKPEIISAKQAVFVEVKVSSVFLNNYTTAIHKLLAQRAIQDRGRDITKPKPSKKSYSQIRIGQKNELNTEKLRQDELYSHLSAREQFRMFYFNNNKERKIEQFSALLQDNKPRI